LSDPLIDAALAARLNAYAKFSNFRVGAAIEDFDGDELAVFLALPECVEGEGEAQ